MDEKPLGDERHSEYRKIVGSVLYLSTRTRPDISAAVGAVAKKVAGPNESDWIAAKRILRYLRKTSNFGLAFEVDKNNETELVGYCDADWAGDIADRKSTGGFALKLNGCLVSWKSPKQASLATSTSEAEYIALFEISKEIVWMRRLLNEVGYCHKNPTIVYEDNQAFIEWARDTHESKTKHIDVKYHYSRDIENRGVISLVYCPTTEMQADILTKPLPKMQHDQMTRLLGVTAC